MAEGLLAANQELVRSLLSRRRLASMALLFVLPFVEFALFLPLFSDAETSVFPLLAVLALLVAGLGAALLAWRILRRDRNLNVPMQELGLFATGGVTSLVCLTLLSISLEAGFAAVLLAFLITGFLLIAASVLQLRLLDKRAGFLAPLLLGTAWPLLAPFQRTVEALWRLTPWLFDSVTLSVLAAVMVLAVLAAWVKASVPVTLRYSLVWAAAVFMMALVPFHEVFGLFSNRAYGEVDRSIAFAGLLAGMTAMAFFVRRNYLAAVTQRELELGDELRRGGLPLEAVKHYDRALAIDKGLAHAWTRKELALRAAGADLDAQQALREVLRLQPDSEGALNEMGVILRRQGKLKEALGYFNKSLDKNPSFVAAWNNKGNTLQNLHQVREAIKCYDRALELNSAFEAALVNKGRALASIGKFRPALDALDKALALRPGAEALWNEKGLVYMKMARYEDALAHFEKALKLNARFEAAWNNKGNALMKLGRAQEALSCYNRALQLNVEYYAAWYNEGSALIDSGDIQGALRCLDEALKLNPASDVAWNERGVALRKLGKLSEAEEHFLRAIKLNPGYPAAWNNRGNVLMDQGRPAEAFECYNVATMIDQKYDKAWYNKGCALLAMGRSEDAVSAFERSVEASLKTVMEADAAAREAGGTGEDGRTPVAGGRGPENNDRPPATGHPPPEPAAGEAKAGNDAGPSEGGAAASGAKG
jgi:tetratricopeptide (TPR) repeat protein